MTEQQKMTQKQFADHLGVMPSYVTKLKQAGRMVFDGKKVLVEASLARIEETKDPNRDDVATRHQKNRSNDKNQTNEKIPAVEVEIKTDSFATARARKESFLARAAEIDFRKKAGEVCELARVHHAAGEAGTIVQTVVSQHLDRFEVDADLDEKQSKLMAEYRDQMLHSIANQVAGVLGKLKEQQE